MVNQGSLLHLKNVKFLIDLYLDGYKMACTVCLHLRVVVPYRMLAKPQVPCEGEETTPPFQMCRMMLDQLGLLAWEQRCGSNFSQSLYHMMSAFKF